MPNHEHCRQVLNTDAIASANKDCEQFVEHILPLVGLSCGEGEAVSSPSLLYLDMILLLSFSRENAIII